MRVLSSMILGGVLCVLAPTAAAEMGELRVEIHRPLPDTVVSHEAISVDVEGGASIFGGVRELDLMLVMDTSKSLRKTDKRDYRAQGAAGLVRNLSPTSDIQVGLVDFDQNAELLVPLTRDRGAVLAGLRELNQRGSTDLAAGIRRALEEFERGARTGSTRAMLLFTDGRSDEEEARRAMEEARQQGVVIHALLLGSDKKGATILGEIAESTMGSFIRVKDPSMLPEAFLNLRTTGVEEVTLRVGDGEAIPARLVGGTFNATLPLAPGENRIVARATSQDGRVSEHAVTVTVRAPGCGELQVQALRDGAPALSLSDRAVEIVFDASNSMWAQLEGEAKISIAKNTLQDALATLPQDLMLGLRVYGHQHPREEKNCQDSELLVPHAVESRDRIRQAISQFRPRGQTPLGYSLERVAEDFGSFQGERAVVLVTDGIESCGGDPVAAARALQEQQGIAVHVIGFGLGQAGGADEASLRAIADASGGRFFTARNAEELREALAVTVGTAFDIWRDATPVASGALGSDEIFALPAGDYVVRLDSRPPRELGVQVASEESLTLVLDRQGEEIFQDGRRRPVAAYRSCEGGLAAAATAADPVPASAAPGLAVDFADAPLQPEDPPESPELKATLMSSTEVGSGTVEIWEDLRPEQAHWAVVLRHPRLTRGASAVWKGDDGRVAKHVAQGVGRALRELEMGMPASAR